MGHSTLHRVYLEHYSFWLRRRISLLPVENCQSALTIDAKRKSPVLWRIDRQNTSFVLEDWWPR